MTNTAAAAQPQVEITGLTKVFKRRSGAGDVIPINDVSLTVDAGEFVVLLGPSGCGKTTLLRSVAGLERPDKGAIRIQGTEVFNADKKLFVPPNRRPISMIFQSYALWPHMTIFGNVAYPITAKKRTPKSEVQSAVREALAKVGLSGLDQQYPGQLSGGQQQRVALARALVTDARVLLFDEPLSNVDAKVREELRAQLVEMQRELGFTALYVTHDQAEAMELADRIAVLNSGRVEQLAPPQEIYSRPATRYVADFVGSANIAEGRVSAATGGTVTVDTPLGAVVSTVTGAASGDAVAALFRPEDVTLHATDPSGENAWQAEVVRVSFVGSLKHVLLHANGVRIQAAVPKDSDVAEGSTVWVTVPAKNVHILAGGSASAAPAVEAAA